MGFELQISGVRINHPTTMMLPVTRKAVAFVVYEIVVVFKAFVQFQIVNLFSSGLVGHRLDNF